MTSSIGNASSGGLRCARTEVVRRLPCALAWLDNGGRELASAMTMLLIPKKPEESTAFFRFQVMKTSDPRDRDCPDVRAGPPTSSVFQGSKGRRHICHRFPAHITAWY